MKQASGQQASGKQACGPLTHGGRLSEARALFPDAPEPWVDLSTGINPYAYPPPHLPKTTYTRLPDPADEAALCRAAAAAYGVADPACVAAAPGTQILIELLPRLFPARTVAVLGPTYGEHEAAWARAGAAVAEARDIDQLADADVGVLCNPNNPDGRRWPAERVRALGARLAARGGLLVVDEAFADLEPEALSVAPALPHPGLIVLRSFGKTYGLAGVRLGFALSDPNRADAIRRALGPWAVSGPAIAIGRAALADAGWRAAKVGRLTEDAARLDALLRRARLRVVGSTRLFRLAAHPDAPALFAALGRAGILVRRFARQPEWLRFGMPAPDGWSRLSNVLANPGGRVL